MDEDVLSSKFVIYSDLHKFCTLCLISYACSIESTVAALPHTTLFAAGAKREAFFKSLLDMLKNEASLGYKALLGCCQRVHILIEQEYTLIPQLVDNSILQQLKPDGHSQKLMPVDCQHIIPLKCSGDGNCLYR